MKDIKSIIDNWVKSSTLPHDASLALHTIRVYTKNDNTIEDFNSLTHCKFIEYEGKRRIITPSGGDSHYFTVAEFDHDIEYENCFDDLILNLCGYIYDKGESILDDTIGVNIQDVKDVLKYFNIPYDFDIDMEDEDYCIENGYYLYTGDGWDDDAEHYFHNSSLYESMKTFFIGYFKYDFAPYTKYNPSFNPFDVDTKKLTLNEKIERMSNEQFAKILVDNFDIKGVFENYSDTLNFGLELTNKINDKTLLKNLLLSLVRGEYYKTLKDKESSLCDRIEYILNI